jgi:hypothetical protein
MKTVSSEASSISEENKVAEKAELTKAWVLQLASSSMLRERFVDPMLLRSAREDHSARQNQAKT